ncbi:MAG: hypothetical protein IPK79_06475 [Vampirovibrionales bacterium]|nr:hypothetical protein [Vampirovibrionales bacterium]
MAKDLQHYVETALAAGADKAAIAQTLIAAGWGAEVVEKTLNQYAGVDARGLLIPVPRLSAHHALRDIFVYLLILTTLSMSSYALGALLFHLIDRLVPDVQPYHEALGSMSATIAQLAVTAPVFFWLNAWLQQQLRAFPQKRESLIRKLMIYLILFVAAVVTLGDLIAILTNFLEGELTSRFLLKALVILSIAMGAFSYYLLEMRQDDRLVQRDPLLKGVKP